MLSPFRQLSEKPQGLFLLILILCAAGMLVTRPDLAPFRAKMDPAYKRIAAYAGEANVRKFIEMVDQNRKG